MLTWNAGILGTYPPLSGYNVYRAASPGVGALVAGPLYSTFYADTGVTNGTAVWYAVRARDARGNPGAPSATTTESSQAWLVNPPMSVGAALGAGGMNVTWGRTVAGQTPGGPTAQYAVLKSTCPACGLASSASVYVSGTVFAWTDAAAIPGSYYRYAVRSVVLAPVHAESADFPWSLVVIPSACGPPNPPASIAATAGSGAVSLAWAAPPVTSPCQLPLSYRVYRSANGGSVWVTLTNTGVGVMAFTDRTALNGTEYVYRVNTVTVSSVESATGATSQPVTPALRASSAFLSKNAFAPVRGDHLYLEYAMQNDGPVSVKIYTISGLKVYEHVIPSKAAGPATGAYTFEGPDGTPGWNGKAADGKYVASGVYLVEFTAGTFKKRMKVIVIK
jgi:hypothetical protein